MTTTDKPEIAPPMNHVFVDFENVREIDLSIIGNKSVSFSLLVGAKQSKMDMALVEKLLKHSASVQLIRLEQTGRNAVDFALAYYLGRAVLADPKAWFHVVSKDKGYDPLIAHLARNGFKVKRHADFTSLSFAAAPKPAAVPGDPLVSAAIEHLKKSASNRPSKRTKLTSYLKSYLGNDRTESEISSLIDRLEKAGHLTVDPRGSVTYKL